MGNNKRAIAIYGRFNNRYSKESGLNGFKYIKEQILDWGNFDVFVYSNDIENRNLIFNTYEKISKKIIVEKPIDFEKLINIKKIDQSQFVPIESFRNLSNTLAFLYSRKKSLELIKNFSSEENNNYEVIVTCRFDLGQIDLYNGPQDYRVSKINFNPAYDMNYFYSAMWNQLNAGFADQWFFSKPSQMYKLIDMYEECFDYFQSGSDYFRFITEGIEDSNINNAFSNEIFKSPNQKSKFLSKRSIESSIDNHLLHKYFFIKKDIYNKSRFLSNFDNVAHVLYSHSDYEDVLRIYFNQKNKYFNAFSRNYLVVNRQIKDIPNFYQQIIYNEQDTYTQRLQNALTQVKEDFIFFDHEDMFLTDFPIMKNLNYFVDKLKKNKLLISFIKLSKNKFIYSIKISKKYKLGLILPWSNHIFSIQPTFWKKDKFIQLLSQNLNKNIWQFEESANAPNSRLKIFGAQSENNSNNLRGLYHYQNQDYPYIATAISKGKWNFSEYREELETLFLEYNVSPQIRGDI